MVQARSTGRLERGIVVSVLVHAHVLVPLGIVAWHRAALEEASRAEEVDVSFETEIGEAAGPAQRPEPRKKRDQRNRKARSPEAVAAAPEDVEAPPEVEVPTLPPMPPVPRPAPVAGATPVDLDMGKDVEPPPDTRYLAQRNNRAEVETRATDTALDRAQEGVEGSSPSRRKDETIGDDVEKARIAESEDVPSELGRRAPAVKPHADPTVGPAAPARESLLAMRQEHGQPHEITPETADPSLPRDPDGALPEPAEAALSGDREAAAHAKEAGKRVRLGLSMHDYEHVFGADAEAARRLAQKQRSKRPGRFAERMGRVRAALENFIPEVRPGNQTALNTRAAPFAVFVARMHRSIHKLWGFGLLEDWDGKSSSSPFNDRNLASKLEIVLDADGLVEKVTVVQASGYLPYDAAAIDVVYSAGPYPDPPREIRSGNGKIYLHWLFRRDEHQCHPSGVDYYILDNAPPSADRLAAAPAGAAETAPRVPGADRALKRLAREPSGSPHVRKTRELDEPDPEAARRAAAMVARPDDPGARKAVRAFFEAYVRQDASAMLATCGYPFSGAAGVLAKGPTELAGQLRSLVGEAPQGQSIGALEVYSAAGLRGALGYRPEAFGDGTGLLFGIARTGGDTFVVALDRKQGVWKVVGLLRR